MKLTRGHGTRDLPPSLLVVCEGRTEKRLLDGLRGRWRIPAAQIECVGDAGVPSSVVSKALELRDDHVRTQGKSSQIEVWVVFDRDAHPCWSRAIDRARALRFELAISNPCIELWGILLHEDQQAHIERDRAQRRLSQLHPAYHHDRNPYFELNAVERGRDDASRRAAVLKRRAEEAGDPLANPTTSFCEVVERLRSLFPASRNDALAAQPISASTSAPSEPQAGEGSPGRTGPSSPSPVRRARKR